LKKKTRLWVLLTFSAAPLLPEYLAPVTTLMAFCFLLKYFQSTGRRIVLEKEHKLMLVFVCWQFVGIFYSNNKGNSLMFSLLWLFMFLGFIFVFNFVDSKKRLEEVLFAVTITGGIAGSVGVGQIVLLNYGDLIADNLKTVFNPFWGSLDILLVEFAVKHLLPASIVENLPRLTPHHIINRASSTFTNPIFIACYLVMVLPLAVYCVSHFKSWKKKIVILACIVMIVGGIACSYSRAPYLAVIVVVFVMLFMGWKQALAILAASPVFLMIFPSGVYKRLLSLLNVNDGSIQIRSRVWEACTEMLREKWLWGMGPGVGNVRDMLIGQYNIYQPHAHNLFLQLYLEGGIFGGTVFAVIILWVLVDLVVLYFRSKEARPLAVAVIASLVGFLTCGVTDYVLYGPKILQFFMMLLGLALAVKKIYSAKVNKTDLEPATLLK
jgi:O-antigen ligase